MYRIEYRNCNLKYVGQNSRRLKNRIVSHASDVNLSNKYSASSELYVKLRHIAIFNDVSILCQERSWFEEFLFEMGFIKGELNAMNRQYDI